MRFSKHVPGNATLKVGLMGFAGGGKTRTAAEFAVGMVRYLREMGHARGARPVWFLDTEGGSDYVAPVFTAAGIEMQVDRSRAFADLLDGARAANDSASVLIVDSITHIWREFCDAYQRRKNRKRLEFQDWAYLKAEWQKWTDAFLGARCDIIMCGRAGYEYDHETDDNGRKELVKTGIKMKAEGEMAYEPPLLLLLERHEDPESHRVRRVATVIKDRCAVIDGQRLTDPDTGGPTFEHILPHVRALAIGGEQAATDSARTSDALFPRDHAGEWRRDEERRTVALAEIREELVRLHPGQTAADKRAKGDLLEMAFGTRAWERVETMGLGVIHEGRDRIWRASRGEGYMGDARGSHGAGQRPLDESPQGQPAEPGPDADSGTPGQG